MKPSKRSSGQRVESISRETEVHMTPLTVLFKTSSLMEVFIVAGSMMPAISLESWQMKDDDPCSFSLFFKVQFNGNHVERARNNIMNAEAKT
jgi:hypothetical protein